MVDVPADPCNPSPCGANAECSNGACSCLPDYLGNPYELCQPECVINDHCPFNRACVRNKCVDPCIGTCGQNAVCDVSNHVPMCSCPAGMSGNAFVLCSVLRGACAFRITECTAITVRLWRPLVKIESIDFVLSFTVALS